MNENPITPLPEKIEIITGFETITIRRKWMSATAFGLLFFSLFWNGFMVVWMSIAISQGTMIMAAFGTLHAGVGIFLAYYTICLFINKTDIEVSSSFLSVTHHPLPWFGKKNIPVHDVSQLFCEKKVTRNKNSTTITYEVHVVTTDNKKKKLLTGLPESDQATFIEKEIETTLGIKNRPVSGEL